MQKLSTQLVGFAPSSSSTVIAMIGNAWIENLRYHAVDRAQDGVIAIEGEVTSDMQQAANKLAYMLSTSIQSTLDGLFCFSDVYRNRHDGLSRPSVLHIMRHDNTLFEHGVLNPSFDTEIAPKFAIQFTGASMEQLVNPIDLVIGVNLNAYKNVRDYCKAKALGNISEEAYTIMAEVAKAQISAIRAYAKQQQQMELGLDYGLIDKISKLHKTTTEYKVAVLGRKLKQAA